MFETAPAEFARPVHIGLGWSKLAPSALGLVLIGFLFTQWDNPAFNPGQEDPLMAVLKIEHSAANHIASVYVDRTAHTPNPFSLRNNSAILATTGMVSFPFLRTTNH